MRNLNRLTQLKINKFYYIPSHSLKINNDSLLKVLQIVQLINIFKISKFLKNLK